MSEEKYQYEKQQIAEAEEALRKAKEEYEKAKEEYVAKADAFITELAEYTRKNQRRITFKNKRR